MFADHHPGLLLQRAAPIAHNATEGDIGQTSDTANTLYENASLCFVIAITLISPLCRG